jgi:hypothetical protein
MKIIRTKTKDLKEGEEISLNPFETDSFDDVQESAPEQLAEAQPEPEPEPEVKSEPEPQPVERKRKSLALNESKTERGNNRFTPDWEGREITLGLPWVHEASKRTLIALLALAVDCG